MKRSSSKRSTRAIAQESRASNRVGGRIKKIRLKILKVVSDRAVEQLPEPRMN